MIALLNRIFLSKIYTVRKKCVTFQCAKYILSPVPQIPRGIALNSLDVVRNSRLEVGRQVRSAFRAKTSVWLKAALETRQTADMLAGQDARLCELLKTNWAGNAKPLKSKILSIQINNCTVALKTNINLGYAKLRHGDAFLLVSYVDSKCIVNFWLKQLIGKKSRCSLKLRHFVKADPDLRSLLMHSSWKELRILISCCSVSLLLISGDSCISY